MKYIYHHWGLGDHIICNGMVRHYYETDNDIRLFCNKRNVSNIEYMYRDLNKIELHPFDYDDECVKYIKDNHIEKDLIEIGHKKCNRSLNISFDMDFYRIAGLDFSIRFKKFYIERDHKKEDEVFNKLNSNNEKFIFVHDDPSKGYSINISKINTKYKVIRNDMQFLVFNYIKLIERAEEVHFMQSSFKELICSYMLEQPKLYQHNYVRNYNAYMNSIGLNKITEIN